MGLVVNAYDYYVFGDVFLRSYYTIYDMDNVRMGIAPHLTSYASPIVAAGIPSESFSGSSDVYWYSYGGVFVSIFGLVVIPLTCLGGCFIFIYYCFVSPYKAVVKQSNKYDS